MRVCFALRPGTTLEKGDTDGMHAILGADPGETWDIDADDEVIGKAWVESDHLRDRLGRFSETYGPRAARAYLRGDISEFAANAAPKVAESLKDAPQVIAVVSAITGAIGAGVGGAVGRSIEGTIKGGKSGALLGALFVGGLAAAHSWSQFKRLALERHDGSVKTAEQAHLIWQHDSDLIHSDTMSDYGAVLAAQTGKSEAALARLAYFRGRDSRTKKEAFKDAIDNKSTLYEKPLYRGIEVPKGVGFYEVGSEFSIPDHASATTRRSVAERFAGIAGNHEADKIIFKINPSKVKTLEIPNTDAYQEFERVIPAKTRFIVRSKQEMSKGGVGYTELTVDMLPGEDLIRKDGRAGRDADGDGVLSEGGRHAGREATQLAAGAILGTAGSTLGMKASKNPNVQAAAGRAGRRVGSIIRLDAKKAGFPNAGGMSGALFGNKNFPSQLGAAQARLTSSLTRRGILGAATIGGAIGGGLIGDYLGDRLGGKTFEALTGTKDEGYRPISLLGAVGGVGGGLAAEMLARANRKMRWVAPLRRSATVFGAGVGGAAGGELLGNIADRRLTVSSTGAGILTHGQHAGVLSKADGRAGRDGDGDGIFNEKAKRAASALGTAALIGAGIGGGVIAGKKLKARHIKQAARATASAARVVGSVLPKSSLGSKVGGVVGLSVAGHLADYLTRRGSVEIGVDLSREEADAAAKDANAAALQAGPMGSPRYVARYDQEIARVVAHNRALGDGPIGSAADKTRFNAEFSGLDPAHRGVAERVGRAVTGAAGAVAGGAAGTIIGAGAGALGGKIAAYLANDLTGSNLNGGLTGAAAGAAAGGYKGGQLGYDATASVGGVIGRGVDRLFKFDGVHVSGPGGGRRWDPAKHPRDDDGKFTFKNGGGAASLSSPNEIESRRKDDIARSVGTITGAVGGAIGGLAGGLAGGGIGSVALGFAGNVAGDYAGRELGERVTRAFMAGDSRSAYRELLSSTNSDSTIGETLGGVAGNLAGDQAGRLGASRISSYLASRGGSVLGTKGTLAAGVIGSIAGEFGGQALLAKPIDDAFNDMEAENAAAQAPAGRLRKADDQDDWTLVAQISKVDDDKRMVYGWASVIEENGRMVTDRQGDEMDVDELVKAAHDFMLNARVTGEMHKKLGVGQAVESMVFTHDLQKALGVDLGRVGWFVGMKINDEKVWKRVKDGELGFLSIGGRGVRKPIDVDAEMKVAAGVAT